MRRGGHVGRGARWAVVGLVLLGALATSCRNVATVVTVNNFGYRDVGENLVIVQCDVNVEVYA